MTAPRGRVWKVGNTWHYEVTDGTKVVLADNTGDWRKVYDLCRFDVRAVQRVLLAGHRFKRSFGELVARAQGDQL